MGDVQVLASFPLVDLADALRVFISLDSSDRLATLATR